MDIDIVCSSRELFGADRSAMRLAAVLRDVGATPKLVVPAHRPELGLADAAAARGIAYEPRPVAIASSRGAEGAGALLPRRPGARRARADVSILNTTAVVGVDVPGRRKVLMIREWLEPGSPKHRALALRHRLGLDAVVGISRGVLEQWRACVRGPRVQAIVPNWLEDAYLPAVPVAGQPRDGIVCLGRFNQWKGQEVLADAFERAFGTAAPQERPRLTFLGAQPGTPFAAAADAMAERGRTAGWTVLPFDDDPRGHLDRAALLVLPSLHPEPFGMVILEALARGCRVVAFPGGGPDDLAEPFAHALAVVPRGADPLAAALRTWWADGGTAQSDGEWAQTLQAIRDGWSHAAAVRRWQSLLTRLA